MQAAIEELEPVGLQMIKFLDNWFRFLGDHITDMADTIATTNINVHVKRSHQKRTVFNNRKRLLKSSEEHAVHYIPGIGSIKILPMEYED